MMMTTMMFYRRIALAVAAFAVVLLCAAMAFRPAAAPQPTPLAGQFTKTDVMIPMRDGVRLHTEIFVPRPPAAPASSAEGERAAAADTNAAPGADSNAAAGADAGSGAAANAQAGEKLPFIFERTPYGVTDDASGMAYQLRRYRELIRDRYIFVFQDIRGRFKSEGKFVMNRPPRADKSDPKSFDESTDTYDTISWLLKNVPGNNGRVGILGISYGGELTTDALMEPHPALKAASEQASPADQFLGDDFHHNGAFRLSYGFEYSTMMETSKENASFPFDRADLFQWYLGLGPLSNVNRLYLHGRIPTWNDFVNHPNYDAFWKRQAIARYLGRARVPNLNVAGWWDQEDFYGPLKIYETYAKNDPDHLNYLVVGPWRHGQWAADGSSLGPLRFGEDTSAWYRAHLEAPWFAYWLKGQGTLPSNPVQVFQTGTNRWESYSAWPPREAVARRLYFHDAQRLTFEPPTAAEHGQFDAYIADPAHPVPYRPRPIPRTYPGEAWRTWLEQDQRFVDDRPDVATWETAPLDRGVTVAGDIVAHLFASTTGTDSDWVVKLIDVYPEQDTAEPQMAGYELIVADEVFRGRFRRSFEHPEPLVPNRVTPFAIDLHTNDHAFLPGHRIMVQVQSSWFPVIDRNPQTFVPNIYKAVAGDFHVATQRIWRTPAHASYVELPVVQAR
jgi:putative CocE/NonD family hydrolase